MSNVYLLYMPPGNAQAMVHYQDTIKTKVPLSRIFPHISPHLRPDLIAVFGKQPSALWGSSRCQRNPTNFDRMSQGDDNMFDEGYSIKLIGKVAANLESKALSYELWQPLRSGGD